MTQHFEPREYQKIAARFMLDNPRSMLVADPGLGKTSISLSVLDLLKMAGSDVFPALVLAPKRVADVVWTNERERWDAFQDLSMIKIMGPEDERRDALRKAKADVYICNYEMVPWLVEQFPFTKWPFRTVIADESSKLKGFRLNQGSKRAHALSKVARYTCRWHNLTGTPCPQGLQDLWGQTWFLDFGAKLKRSYTAYMEAFFIENQYSRKVTLQHGAEAAIHELMKDQMLALRAEDWLDILKPQEIEIAVELPAAARQQYKEMEKDFFTQVSDRDIEAGTAAVKSFKLLQISSGSVYDDTSMPHAVHDAKIEGLLDILDQTGSEPILVSYWWKFDVPRIQSALQKLGITCRVYSGKKDEDDWNAGKIRVLLLHSQSAFGLSLHKVCRDVVFYSYVWNADLHQQMVERVGSARQAQLGLKRVVRVWTIRTIGTIEGEVIASNTKKISIEQALKRARARSRTE